MGISIIFVTLGSKGCFVKYKVGSFTEDSYKVHSIDTTGALTTTKKGAINAIPYLDEIERLIENQLKTYENEGVKT